MPYRNIVFMGTPNFSIPILEAIVKSSYKISCVYTQVKKKSNRGQKLNTSPIEKYAESSKLVIRNPVNINSDEEFDFFKKLNPDIVVVVAYGQLISKKLLNIPKKGFINVHASLLPKWRGAAPIQRSIMNLDTETGISMMQIVEELDSGPVIEQFKVKIKNTSTSGEISDHLSKIGSENIVNTLNSIFNKKLIFSEQNHRLATYAKKIKKSETKINWQEKAEKIVAKINGLNPDLGAWFVYKDTRYIIWKAKIYEKKGTPGKILNSNFVIGCGDKSLEIIEIQKEGKNKLLLKNFLTGCIFNQGDELK
jgi:methionyl-tRNA formyltransferase